MTRVPAPEPAGLSARARWTRRLFTWSLLVILFIALFKLVPAAEVMDQFRGLDAAVLARLAALSLVIIAGVALLDGTAMWYGFSRFKISITWKEIVLLRTAMMLLASIATLIGQAGLAAHVARKHRIKPGAATGMVLFLFLVEIYGMISVATIGLPLLLIFGKAGLKPGAPVLATALILTSAWAGLAVTFYIVKRLHPEGLLKKIKLDSLIEPMRTVSFREFIILLSLKTLLAAWQIFMTKAAFIIYGIELSLFELLAFMPAAILVSSLPITPARLGTTQWSWKFFFDYRIGAPVLVAFSLLLQFILNLARWLLGALALPLIFRDLVRPETTEE